MRIPPLTDPVKGVNVSRFKGVFSGEREEVSRNPKELIWMIGKWFPETAITVLSLLLGKVQVIFPADGN